jgi:4-amino-4-deoxy-L-arabinose transferase-like glycosyltransferase
LIGKKYIPYLTIAFLVILTASWYVIFISNSIPINLMAFYIRIQPFIIWCFLFSLLNILSILVLRSGFHWDNFLHQWKDNQKTRFALLASFLILIAVFVMNAFTKYDNSSLVFWTRNGVPVLNSQILASSISLLIVFYLVYKVFRPKSSLPIKTDRRVNLSIFLLIWIIASVLWLSTPQQTSLFNPGPFKPDNAFYPWSDARTYDNCAQFVLLGQKYCNGSAVNYPLYDGFLLLLHLLAGQNNSLVISLQVIIVALVPALLFLIGKSLFNRFAGLLAGILVIFQIRNAIFGGLAIWDLSYPKMMMTEPLALLFLVLFCFWLIKYLQNPQRNSRYALLSGIILGLATLIRHNIWALVPVFSLAIIFSTKRFVRILILFGVGFLLAIGPWAIRNVANGSQPIYVLEYFQDNVLKNRYPQPTPTDENNTSTGGGGQSSTTLPTAQVGTNVNSNANPSTIEPSPEGLSSLQIIFSHFLHSAVASVLALPTTHATDSLIITIKNAGSPTLWSGNWAGQIDPEQAAWIVFNLLVISVGIGSAIKKMKVAGVVPLLVFIMYDAGSSIAKTSGGRYIAPINWVMLFYFAFGITQIIIYILSVFKLEKTIAQAENIAGENLLPKKANRFRFKFVFIAFFISISILLPISEYVFPKRDYNQNKNYIDTLLDTRKIKDAAISQSLRDPTVSVLYGKAFYPRIFFPGDENLSEFFPFFPQDRTGLFITVLNQNGGCYVYLPLNFPLYHYDLMSSINGTDVIVFGKKDAQFKCYPSISNEKDYTTASTIILLEKQPIIYHGIP